MNNSTPSTSTNNSNGPADLTGIRPHSEWDEDESFDGRPKAATINILVVSPDAVPYPRTLDNTLDAMQEIIGGYTTSFETGVFDAVGIAPDPTTRVCCSKFRPTA